MATFSPLPWVHSGADELQVAICSSWPKLCKSLDTWPLRCPEDTVVVARLNERCQGEEETRDVCGGERLLPHPRCPPLGRQMRA